MASRTSEQDRRYLEAAAEFGPALDRLGRGYEADPDLRRDLRQDIHIALWKSLGNFDGRCSLRTWVYRVAHNTGASHVLKRKAQKPLAGIEELDDIAGGDDPERTTSDRQAMEWLSRMILALKPPDRQVLLLYLEDLDAAAIGEITGLSPGAIAVKVHRLKAVLAQRFQEGAGDVR